MVSKIEDRRRHTADPAQLRDHVGVDERQAISGKWIVKPGVTLSQHHKRPVLDDHTQRAGGFAGCLQALNIFLMDLDPLGDILIDLVLQCLLSKIPFRHFRPQRTRIVEFSILSLIIVFDDQIVKRNAKKSDKYSFGYSEISTPVRDRVAHVPKHLSKEQDIPLKAGDRVRVETLGDGYGDPRQRDPALVRRDVEMGYYPEAG